MDNFENFNLSKPLRNVISELGFDKPTPVQQEAFPLILSGKDMVAIAQTGTGKTFAYMLPLLQNLKFSKQINPRIMILVPTRELVIQMLEMIESYSKYINVRILGIYGGTNINNQKYDLAQGTDILVATPGRIYDLVLCGALKLNSVKKLVIDEVDVMLDLGFRFQLTNIFDLMPAKRQNIMFSATMTEEVDALIEDFFITPAKISIAVSGTPLDNIAQYSYPVQNFYTKINLLIHLLENRTVFQKVLVFTATKKSADYLFEALAESNGTETCVIHSNKSQNYRIRSLSEFDEGKNRILIATDVMARGLDLNNVTHVINFDTPAFPENYMHRIGRTGRVEQQGTALLFYTDKEQEAKKAIETLMNYEIPVLEFPSEVEISTKKIPDEQPRINDKYSKLQKSSVDDVGDAFHEKKLKNTKVNQGGSYLRKMKTYKKPKTRGDKFSNKKRK